MENALDKCQFVFDTALGKQVNKSFNNNAIMTVYNSNGFQSTLVDWRIKKFFLIIIYGYALSLASVIFVYAARNWGEKSNTSDSKEKDCHAFCHVKF